MRMKSLAAALLIACAGSARAQQFGAVGELSGSLAAFKAHAFSADSVGVAGAPASEAPDTTPYPVRGADVSKYQGDIEWAKLGTSGISFVYIKATEGGADVDPKFERNWKGAKAAGLARGAYHFYDFCQSAGPQAANLIRTVPVVAGDLPPTIDIEDSRGCRKMPTKEAFQKSLKVFLAKVEAHYHRKPLLYVNHNIYDRYLADADGGLKLWIADPHHATPLMPVGTDWTLWQFSWSGRLPGIAGPVDLDVFRGTPEMLASLTQPDGTPIMLAALP